MLPSKGAVNLDLSPKIAISACPRVAPPVPTRALTQWALPPLMTAQGRVRGTSSYRSFRDAIGKIFDTSVRASDLDQPMDICFKPRTVTREFAVEPQIFHDLAVEDFTGN